MDKEIYLNQSIIKLTKIIKLNKIKNNSFTLYNKKEISKQFDKIN